MTPKPTLDLEDLKKKALAATSGARKAECNGHDYEFGTEDVVLGKIFSGPNMRHDADLAAAVSPDVVLDLLERLTGMEEALETIGWDAVEASKGAAMAHKVIALSALKLWGTK